MNVNELLKQLQVQQDAYHETLRHLLEATVQGTPKISNPAITPLTTQLPDLPPLSPASRHPSQSVISFVDTASLRREADTDSRRRDRERRPRKPSMPESSALSFEDGSSDDERDESLYVQNALPTQSIDLEGFRSHLISYQWNAHASRVLEDVIGDRGRLQTSSIFPSPSDPIDKRTEYQQFQTFDIGTDGAPLPVEVHTLRGKDAMGKEKAIWHAFKDINADPSKERKAVGRIVVAREPSPVMFAALHHAYNAAFNMDILFKHLVEAAASSAEPNQVFHDDQRMRRSFVFNFEYYTIIGEECKPMKWQLADREVQRSKDHIPITRCSSVVALSLAGEPIKKLRNSSRRAKKEYGYVHDPWAAWTVLNIQCYPDWIATMEGHEPSSHYVNGPEAFMTCLLTEFCDAQKRYEDIYKSITKLVTPPHDFIFNSEQRDKLLFEDSTFTFSKRYFWAFQTLGSMNDSIKALVDSYEDTFTEAVWTGTHKTIWPMIEEHSARSLYYKKRMGNLKRKFETQIKNLRQVMLENNERREEIKSLFDQLFSGTSIQESRKTVEQTEITIQQNYNIKVLTLVNIFFLPPTFVTSVFGMTNMPTAHHYWMFGSVVVAVCVPFFILIGSLNTTHGYHFWREILATIWIGLVRCVDILSCRRPRSRTELEALRDVDNDSGLHEPSSTARNVAAMRRRENSKLYGVRSRTLSMDSAKAADNGARKHVEKEVSKDDFQIASRGTGTPMPAATTMDSRKGREASQTSIVLGRLMRRKTDPVPSLGDV